jgi:hypothetical protein
MSSWKRSLIELTKTTRAGAIATGPTGAPATRAGRNPVRMGGQERRASTRRKSRRSNAHTPATPFEHPVTGFHVASVHSMRLRSAMAWGSRRVRSHLHTFPWAAAERTYVRSPARPGRRRVARRRPSARRRPRGARRPHGRGFPSALSACRDSASGGSFQGGDAANGEPISAHRWEAGAVRLRQSDAPVQVGAS